MTVLCIEFNHTGLPTTVDAQNSAPLAWSQYSLLLPGRTGFSSEGRILRSYVVAIVKGLPLEAFLCFP